MTIGRSKREIEVTPKLASELERDRPKRYLVLGSEGHGLGIKSYRWDKMPEGLNVADFDVLILNFAAFDDSSLAYGFPKERLPTKEQMARLIFSPNAEVIAIGDPRRAIGRPPDRSGGFPGGYDTRWRADYWLPIFLDAKDDSGTSYSVLTEEWQFYFDQLSGWTWILGGESQASNSPQDYMKPVTREITNLEFLFQPLAWTRYEAPIALRIHLQAVREFRYNPRSSPVATSHGIAKGKDVVVEASPLFWLPTPDRCTVSEAIDLILRERYGVAAPERQPEWLVGYELPAEQPIKAEIAHAEEERRAAEQRLSEARQRATDAALPKRLLYEKGKEVLEPVVRDVLRELGAQVDDPEREGVEDGRLYVGEARAVIEIKGRDGPIKQDDVRQVVQWQSDAKLEEGHDHKAIIFGNPFCQTSPDQRGEPLATNAKTYAENGDVAFVSTMQLYEALRQKQEGIYDEAAFWEKIFDGAGPVDLPTPDRPRSTNE